MRVAYSVIFSALKNSFMMKAGDVFIREDFNKDYLFKITHYQDNGFVVVDGMDPFGCVFIHNLKIDLDKGKIMLVSKKNWYKGIRRYNYVSNIHK